MKDPVYRFFGRIEVWDINSKTQIAGCCDLQKKYYMILHHHNDQRKSYRGSKKIFLALYTPELFDLVKYLVSTFLKKLLTNLR